MSVPPITISFMLNCHFSTNPEEALGENHWNSPAGKETRAWLKVYGLIDENNRSTNRGAAWVNMMCQTPLPIEKWVDPRDEN